MIRKGVLSMQYFLAVLYGLVFGIANIIPGVSGGTMLVVFGCYDKVCGALSLNLKEIKKNIVFLIFFGIGAVTGIVAFSFVITWLFEKFPIQTFMFFIGLIIGSIPLIVKNATVSEKFRPLCLLPFIVALSFVIGLTVFENNNVTPYSINRSVIGSEVTVTVENNSDRTIDDWNIEIKEGGFDIRVWMSDQPPLMGAKMEVKSGLTERIKEFFGSDADRIKYINIIRGDETTSVIPPHSSVSFTYNNNFAHFKSSDMKLSVSYAMDLGFFITLVAVSFAAAVAMIIPGVSGSFIMVLFGTYGTVIGAIKNLDLMILLPTAVGVIAGIILGARLISFLLKKYRLMVFSAILGLVIGSIYAILPSGFGVNTDTLLGALALAAGFVISFIVGKYTKIEKEEDNAVSR